MIARVWTARTSREQAPAYAEYLRTHIFPELRGIDGYQHAMLLQRETDHGIDVQVITVWRSLDAIRDFAGADLESAVVTDLAATLLTDYDRRVRHYEIAATDDSATPSTRREESPAS